MDPNTESARQTEKLNLELRRGTLVLAVLSQLPRARYGYSLMQRLADKGLEVEQGTLYPLLRRLADQGLLESRWDVSGSRPRKYYELSPVGETVLRQLTAQWHDLAATLTVLLDGPNGDPTDGTD